MKYLNDISYKDCIGKVCKSKSSGDFKILKYNDCYNVEIQFLNTGYEVVVRLDCIRNGNGEVAVIEASSCSSCWQVGPCNQHVFARAGEVLKIDESQAEWNGSQWVAPLA